MKHKRNEGLFGRWLALLLLCLLGGGGLTANAAERAWAKYDDATTTLTFYYGEKGELGEGEFKMPSGYDLETGWASKYGNVMTKVVFDASFAQAKLTSLYRWFYGCTELRKIEGISNLNTSEVGSMRYMFRDCTSLESLDLSSFNTEKVTNMSYMFDNCTSLKKLDLSSFNTSIVTDMSYMFRDCTSLESLDLSSFNTSVVTIMYNIFTDCASLTSLDLSSFNTEKLTFMSSMFRGCASLESLDLSSFNTSIVTDMKYMFESCPQLQVIYASDKFVVGENVTTSDMFKGCTSLQGEVAFDPNYTDKTYAKVDGGYFTDKQYIRSWAKYADGTLTFRYSYKKDLGDGEYTMNEGTNYPGWLEHQSSITRVVFDESFAQARPKSCFCWFYNCRELTEIEGMSNLNTSEVTDMYKMFFYCSKLASLDLSKFSTANVTNMLGMFENCTSLASLYISSEFNTANVTKMYSMFRNCSKLASLDLSKFSTANVTDMSWMFAGCSKLTSLDLSNFSTANVTDMSWMFSNCSTLASLDLSNFSTANVTDMSLMFVNCSKLQVIYASDKFEVRDAANSGNMFDSTLKSELNLN